MSAPPTGSESAYAGGPCAVSTAKVGASARARGGMRTLLGGLARVIRRLSHPSGDASAAADPPSRVAAATPLVLTGRREVMREWWIRDRAMPADTIGLALSGGGIRSATFSLGVLQALACADRLRSIDVLSTVSGGSYIGCFLRSLFMPVRFRGIAPSRDPEADVPSAQEIAGQYDFAMRALRSSAGVRSIAGPGPNAEDVCNPLWWLREHSRYLAPNGPTDYSYAIAYLSRNWVAMLYVFAVGAAAVLALSAYVEAGLWHLLRLVPARWQLLPPFALATDAAAVAPPGACNVHVVAAPGATGSFACPPAEAPHAPPAWRRCSPLVALALLPGLISLGLSVAYWLTAQMSVNDPSDRNQRGTFRMVCGWVVVAIATIALGLHLDSHVERFARLCEYAALALLVLELVIGLLLFARVRSTTEPPQMLTAELRRRLTTAQALANGWMLLLLGLGLVETLAAGLRRAIWEAHAPKIGGVALLPALAFLIKKLPDWAGGGAGGGGKLGALVARCLPAIALLAGLLLYGTVAVLVDTVVQAAAWTHASWWSAPDLGTGAMMACTIVPLALLTGHSTGFINLSSLHNLYGSRLIRAYLGATNVERLRSIADPKTTDVGIRDNHHLDYIQPRTYGELVLPAPLHIINATLNRTIDPKSQLVARDRKGELTTVEPHGVRVGSEGDGIFLDWSQVGDRHYAESLSLGQWLAISGAAASSGMGRLTNLGYAMALTFANVRLGFWWWVPESRRRERNETQEAGGRAPPWQLLADQISTFFYLFNEMTARYSPSYKRQYLSDGGHFENMGAYALIRRDVPRIIVCDNAEDAGYAFADVENLVRKIRLDLQGEMTLLGGEVLAAFRSQIGCDAKDVFVDPAAAPDWKATFRRGEGSAFALAFEIVKLSFDKASTVNLRLVIIKPRLLPGLPEDVAGYAGANPAFPQQSTGDQFFDEAQWESYRRLGQFCMARLLNASPGLLRA